MEHPLHNQIGQIVGQYDDYTKTYHSIRDKSKGEIFLKKQWFEGKYLSLPIALDAPILQKLIQIGCKTIHILIMGVRERSYMVSFSPEWILENGVEINYDRYNKQGKNITHFSNQLVFDADKGVGINQKTLNS